MQMSSHHSCQLIRILVPVIIKRKELNDALAITIRKNMFSRHVHHRIMAGIIMNHWLSYFESLLLFQLTLC